MTPFVLTPRAEQDISDIWDYIANDSIEAADRVLAALEKTMFKLAKSPGIGHMGEELADRRLPRAKKIIQLRGGHSENPT